MSNNTTTTKKDEGQKKEKPQGSGEWMREQLRKGWDNPKEGMLPDAIVDHVLKKWQTGKTKINDLYFQANKLRKEEEKYEGLKIREYVKRIEDATGVTERKEKEKAAKEAVIAKEKEAKKKELEERKAKEAAKKAEKEQKAA